MALYGAVYLDRSALYSLGVQYQADTQVAPLDDNASIRVYPETRAVLTRITELVRIHGHGSFMYAGQDMPYLYFLTGLENPTRSLFDFLDTTDSARGAKLLNTLREQHVAVIAINTSPSLSPALERATLRALERQYPVHERIAGIEVRWTLDAAGSHQSHVRSPVAKP